MEQDDRRAFVHSIHLAGQDFRIHDSEHVCVDLHTLLFAGRHLSSKPFEDRLAQPRLELVDLAFQEPPHDPWQGVLHDILPPGLQREVGIEFAQLVDRHRFRCFRSEGVVHATDSVHPWILTRLPCLSGILRQMVYLLLGVLGTRFLHELIRSVEHVLDDGGFRQAFLHTLPRSKVLALVDDHDLDRARVLLVALRCGHRMADLLVDVLRLTRFEQILPGTANLLLERGPGTGGGAQDAVKARAAGRIVSCHTVDGVLQRLLLAVLVAVPCRRL
mmetsp:Transcript_17280/g.47861  ORF Transcript_17280/g.47861 Transcript_17280/m.47861 type:complete len:274 (+) Transcript_17280:2026-2847(+)